MKSKLDFELEKTVKAYNSDYDEMVDKGKKLHEKRVEACELIRLIERLVSSIADHPKKFDTEIAEIELLRHEFVEVCAFQKKEIGVEKNALLGTAAGAGLGVAAAAAMPAVTMWIATTFGTASTGTAIAALSGAAANSAALAWIGGGALAAGGGGMAAGSAFLTLSGPVGWVIGGTLATVSIGVAVKQKHKLAEQKKEEIEAIRLASTQVRRITSQIEAFLQEVEQNSENVFQQYNDACIATGKDFLSLTTEQQIKLGVLVNNTHSLSLTLGKTVEE